MQHAIINAMKCMRAIKGRIARPVNQLENHLNRDSIPRTVYQPGKSSVRDLQSPLAHHSSVVFRHNQSVGHHSDDRLDFLGMTHLSASHNVALNQVINQSINQAQDVCISISAYFTTSITAMFTLKAVKSAQFVPPTDDLYLNRYNKARKFQPAPTSFHLAPSTMAEAILNLKSVKESHNQFLSISNLNFNTEFTTAKNSNPVLPLNKVLTSKTKLRTVGIPYPEAEISGRTINFHTVGILQQTPAVAHNRNQLFLST
ncbi:ubiquitin-specific protease [Dorcoceras hygrometricum]|uniref:Ubiquitin-specific protease n=1 Tax=Dorcoceras hygrometricum TaxID=472368 RepID=A0A2Z7BMY5_9LAMI|nr:ubiquitin-specific protease [Dorcoceras hygrometricum]